MSKKGHIKIASQEEFSKFLDENDEILQRALHEARIVLYNMYNQADKMIDIVSNDNLPKYLQGEKVLKDHHRELGRLLNLVYSVGVKFNTPEPKVIDFNQFIKNIPVDKLGYHLNAKNQIGDMLTKKLASHTGNMAKTIENFLRLLPEKIKASHRMQKLIDAKNLNKVVFRAEVIYSLGELEITKQTKQSRQLVLFKVDFDIDSSKNAILIRKMLDFRSTGAAVNKIQKTVTTPKDERVQEEENDHYRDDVDYGDQHDDFGNE